MGAAGESDARWAEKPTTSYNTHAVYRLARREGERNLYGLSISLGWGRRRGEEKRNLRAK